VPRGPADGCQPWRTLNLAFSDTPSPNGSSGRHSGQLLDEAIHLAAAFQLAGFPNVIDTHWTIRDDIAVSVADTFYAQLQTIDGGVNTDHAARAQPPTLAA